MVERHTIHGVPSAAGPRRFRRFVTPALGAAAVSLLVVAAANWLEPLHRRGVAQGTLGVLIGLETLLVAPVDYLVPRGARVAVRALATLALYFAALVVAGAINRRADRWTGGNAPLPASDQSDHGVDRPSPTRRMTRRAVLRGVKRASLGAAAAAGAYPLLVEPRWLAVTRRTFPLSGLPHGLDGLRIVQLADIHHGPWTTIGRVRRIVEITNALAPDLVVLNGDYIQRYADYAPPVAAELAGLRAKVGVVGVLGNHDWWLDGPLCRRELTRAGARMIDNERLFVTTDRKLAGAAGEGLCIAGVGDLWTDKQLYDRALDGVPDSVPRLLLSHNPDVAEEPAFVSSGYRVDLMLSGHTHGGQVVLPFVGAPLTMSRYRQKYVRGMVRGPTCPVFVSRGLGMAMLPVRMGSTPEIAVIELRSRG